MGRYNRRVINYYQPFLWPFLHRQRSLVSGDVKQSYWLSFEDALWELLPQRGIAQGSLVLVPDFYCIDVVENIQAHGYRTEFYELDDQFQMQEQAFKARVLELQPAVVILFHAAGIQCQLVTQSAIEWLGQKGCLVIEDCVHRLVNPSSVQIFGTHHLVMDSLRKVSPLPGSMIYELKGNARANQKTQHRAVAWHQLSIQADLVEFLYQYQALFIFGFFQVVQMLAIMTQSVWLMQYAHQVILKKHDNLVGDSKRGYYGWDMWKWLHSFIHFDKFEKLKQQQVRYYTALLGQALHQHDEHFYQIKIAQLDEPKLHVYPLGLRRPMPTHHLHWLHQHGVVVWPKFSDSPWAKNRGVLFLPLGFHVSDADIQKAVSVVSQLPDLG